MLIDALLLMADGQSVTTSGASTSCIDTTVASIAAGDADKAPWWVVKTNATGFTGGVTATATFALQTCAEPAFGAPTTLASSGAILTAGLGAGVIVSKMRIPKGLLRYVRVYMTVANDTFSVADWSSFFTLDVDANLP